MFNIYKIYNNPKQVKPYEFENGWTKEETEVKIQESKNRNKIESQNRYEESIGQKALDRIQMCLFASCWIYENTAYETNGKKFKNKVNPFDSIIFTYPEKIYIVIDICSEDMGYFLTLIGKDGDFKYLHIYDDNFFHDFMQLRNKLSCLPEEFSHVIESVEFRRTLMKYPYKKGPSNGL